MHSTHFNHEQRRSVPAVLRQFHLHLSQSVQPSGTAGQRGGQALARLIARNPRVVQTFKDHGDVARRLLVSGEVDTLFLVAASGLLHGLSLQFYRLAIEGWLNR